jgi:hypothetical protein
VITEDSLRTSQQFKQNIRAQVFLPCHFSDKGAASDQSIGRQQLGLGEEECTSVCYAYPYYISLCLTLYHQTQQRSHSKAALKLNFNTAESVNLNSNQLSLWEAC